MIPSLSFPPFATQLEMGRVSPDSSVPLLKASRSFEALALPKRVWCGFQAGSLFLSYPTGGLKGLPCFFFSYSLGDILSMERVSQSTACPSSERTPLPPLSRLSVPRGVLLLLKRLFWDRSHLADL